VGLLPSADTVNAVGRAVYVALFMLGLLGQAGVGGTVLSAVFKWVSLQRPRQAGAAARSR
jgi:hypothetical protein